MGFANPSCLRAQTLTPIHSRTLPATTASKHPPPQPLSPDTPDIIPPPPRLPAPLFRNSTCISKQVAPSYHPAANIQQPAASDQQPAVLSQRHTAAAVNIQHPAAMSNRPVYSSHHHPLTQPATNSHLTHQPSPVTHLHGRTQHRHHTAPHCTTVCTALRTRKPYRSIESFLFEPSIGIFLFYFFSGPLRQERKT